MIDTHPPVVYKARKGALLSAHRVDPALPPDGEPVPAPPVVNTTGLDDTCRRICNYLCDRYANGQPPVSDNRVAKDLGLKARDVKHAYKQMRAMQPAAPAVTEEVPSDG